MIVIQKPKKSAYVGSEEVLEILDKLNATDQITSVGVKQKNCKVEGIAKAMKAKKIIYAGTYKKPENKKLMKSKCDLAILSNKILPDEKNDGRNVGRRSAEEIRRAGRKICSSGCSDDR